MRAVLKRPHFRLFFLGIVATMVGESALLLVLAIWVKQLTGSSSLAGSTLFALAAPALAAPLLGWVVDRFRRRPFLVVMLVATAVSLTPLVLVHGRSQLPLIYGVAVLYGASALMTSGATAGLLKELLPDELLGEANGAIQTVRQGLRLIAPIGGAALFAAFGARAVVAVDVVCLIVGAAAIMGVRVREQLPPPGQLRWWGEVGAGVRQLFGPPALRRGTLGVMLAISVLGFAETVVFSYVDIGLHRGPAFVSVIVCVQGLGGLTGGLLAAGFVRRLGEVGSVALGIGLLAIACLGYVYPNLALGLGFSILLGLGIPITLVGFNTLMQRATPGPLMGRVGAAADAVIGTPQALSIAGGALLAAVLDYRAIFVLMTAVLAVAASFLWRGRSLSPGLATAASAQAAPAPVTGADPGAGAPRSTPTAAPLSPGGP